MCDISINVLFQTSALVGALHIITISINISSDNQHALYEQFYHVATVSTLISGQDRVSIREYKCIYQLNSWSQCPRGLRRRASVACLLYLWVRIPPRAWMFVCCECCVVSGRGVCDGLITRPKESYRMWSVVACDQETSNRRRIKAR
jgi:hypothetical protein